MRFGQGIYLYGAILALSGIAWAGTYSGGDGQELTPFQISTAADWQELMITSGDWGAYFELTANIDLTGISLTPVGNSSTHFTGVFNGNGHLLTNAVINQPATDYIGLFGYLGTTGQISCLGVAGGSITGNIYVGGLVGVNAGTITNCYTTKAVTGDSYVGGLVGWNLCGATNGVIEYCYAAGAISGSQYVGGLVGLGTSSGMITACFWDTETTGIPDPEAGQPDTNGVIGLPATDMQNPDTFIDAGWDFVGEETNGSEDIWAVNNGESYPYFASNFPYVYFADANLKAAVEAQLGVTDPTAEDMLNLTYLNAGDLGITNLTGLEYAVNLSEFYAGFNQISDLSPITGLTNLTWLYLIANQINDISPLAGLTNLAVLSLDGNLISDISPLVNLVNLNSLEIGDNPGVSLVDAATLAATLPKLTGLGMSASHITDITPLAGLTKLTDLYLNDNQISDISILAGLTNLTTLQLFYNQISDLSPLAELTNLTGLLLYYNNISDISPLANLTNLIYLHLAFNLIDDINPLVGMTNMSQLFLSNNQICDLSSLAYMTNLSGLSLSDNPLNTPAYCHWIPFLVANNPGIYLTYDSNPNVLTIDCVTDFTDLTVWAAAWLEENCESVNSWCYDGDLDHDGVVNLYDWVIFTNMWQP